MKLTEFIKNVYQINKNITEEAVRVKPDTSPLYGVSLKNPLIFNALKQLDEFKNCNLNISDMPAGIHAGSPYVCKTYILHDDTEITGDAYLFEIRLSPKIYNVQDILKPVKDGIALGPLLYNPEQFVPKRQMLIEIDPTSDAWDSDDIKKEEIHKRIEKALNNPKDYEIKGHHNILIRGYFEKLVCSDTKTILEL